MGPFASFPWTKLSCVRSTAVVKPRASAAPPCLHSRGSHLWTRIMLPLKDHPRVPGILLSPSPPSPAARRDCCSPLASLSAGHCEEKKGRGREAELLHSLGFPCSGLRDEDDGLNLHTSLREGLFQPSLRIRASCFPDWLLPSSQQLWTAQMLRSHACSARASSEITSFCPAGWEQMSAWGRDAFGLSLSTLAFKRNHPGGKVFLISAPLLPSGDKGKA